MWQCLRTLEVKSGHDTKGCHFTAEITAIIV
jgi:hypothetical protein